MPRRPRPLAFVAATCAFVSTTAALAAKPSPDADLAPNVDHGRLVERVEVRGPRRAMGSVFLTGGPKAMGLDELDRELVRAGYSTVGTRAVFGVAGNVVLGDGLVLGVRVEGGPEAIRSGRGIEGRVGYAALAGLAGWSVYRSPSLLAYPFLGVELGRLLVAAKTHDAAAAPLLLPGASAQSADFNFAKAMGTVELGVGAQTVIAVSRAPAKRSGPAVGMQLGYAVTVGESGWVNRDAPARGPQDGPSGAISGPFARVMLGYSWDRYDVLTVERAVGGCDGHPCELVCDPGFADCNADAMDGCETVTGTPENCESCGDSCAIANGSRDCVAEGNAHVCGPPACTPGFVDCNGLRGDGCEAHVATDRDHCGTCDVECAAGERCEAGVCTR